MPLAAEETKNPKRDLPRGLIGAMLVLALLLAVFIGYPYMNAFDQGINALVQEHRSHTAEHRSVALSDGSQMLLDSNTLADVQFNPEQREVTLLRGQAFFSVTHDANRAFYVSAGDVRVRVTGTAFAVNLDDNGVDVSVESGTVAVQTPQASVSATHLLGHGDQLHFTSDGRIADYRHMMIEHNRDVLLDRDNSKIGRASCRERV